MYFWQIAALPACFAFIPNCCPQKICQSIRRQVGSTLFKSRLVHFLPKMPTLHGATPAVKSKHRQTYFPIKILLFRQLLIFLKQIVPLNWQHKRERIALPHCWLCLIGQGMGKKWVTLPNIGRGTNVLCRVLF